MIYNLRHMPTYEYRCKKCGYRFEEMQSITAKPVRRCPQCGGTTERLMGAGLGIIFKGNGFYETDYKRKAATYEKPGAAKTEKKES